MKDIEFGIRDSYRAWKRNRARTKVYLRRQKSSTEGTKLNSRLWKKYQKGRHEIRKDRATPPRTAMTRVTVPRREKAHELLKGLQIKHPNTTKVTGKYFNALNDKLIEFEKKKKSPNYAKGSVVGAAALGAGFGLVGPSHKWKWEQDQRNNPPATIDDQIKNSKYVKPTPRKKVPLVGKKKPDLIGKDRLGHAKKEIVSRAKDLSSRHPRIKAAGAGAVLGALLGPWVQYSQKAQADAMAAYGRAAASKKKKK